MSKRKVSGGIVTYNNGEIIRDCLDAILKNTRGVDFKLYIFDNASTDNTLAIIEEYFGIYVFESKTNRGFGYGHNYILNHIESDYHTVINPDIIIDNDVITALCTVLERNSDVGMITPKILNPDGSEQFLPQRDPNIRFVILSKFKPFYFYRKIYTCENERKSKPTVIDSSTGCFFIISTEVFREVNGFDERYFMYFEDADLSRKVRRKYKIVFHPGYYVYHGWKRENTRSLKGIKIFMQSMMKYLMKWNFHSERRE